MCLHLPLSRIRKSDAVVVLYSIVDRKSFEAARVALAKIGEEKQTMLNDQGGSAVFHTGNRNIIYAVSYMTL